MERKRYSFLTHKRLKDTIFGRALMIFFISGFMALLPGSLLRLARWPWVMMALASFLLAILVAVIARSSYVEVTGEGLEVKSLFGEFFIPYGDIVEASYGIFGKIFEPARQNWSQRIFLQPFWFEPVLVLKLREFPYDYTSIRLLFGKYLFEPEKKVLALLVKDVPELSARVNSALQELRLQKEKAQS